MGSYLLLFLICLFSTEVLYAEVIASQTIYVDCNKGDDSNKGTVDAPVQSIHKAMEIIRSKDNDKYVAKLNPGIYVLDKHVSVSTEKDMTGKRIVMEASILPNDSSWTPEKMPVIISTAQTGEINSGDSFLRDNFITSF